VSVTQGVNRGRTRNPPAFDRPRSPVQGYQQDRENGKKVANAGKKNFELEKSMRDLESIVEQLEGGDLTLDKSLKEFEKGVRLSRECQQALSDAEQKVQILIDSELQETDPKSLKDGT
jgi:exodeoxyribonuclease VII small subunit